MVSRRSAKKLVRALRGLAKRAALLVAAFAILFGIARSGARYYFCAAMDATMAEACCPAADHDHDDGAPGVDAPECCEARRLGSLPASSGIASAPDLGAAPLLAELPPVDTSATTASACNMHLSARAARAGPPPPSARERRAEIMIWTC